MKKTAIAAAVLAVAVGGISLLVVGQGPSTEFPGDVEVAGDLIVQGQTLCCPGAGVPAKDWYFSAAALLPLEHGADSIPPLTKTAGTNADVLTGSYDDTTGECVGGTLPIPTGATGTVTFTAWWWSATATSGNIMWDVRHSGGQVEGITWDTALTTVAAAADATQGTVKQITKTTWTATVATMAWVAGDFVDLEVCRDANHASDTLVGDAQLLGFQVSIPRA